jgi:hypothetical protein
VVRGEHARSGSRGSRCRRQPGSRHSFMLPRSIAVDPIGRVYRLPSSASVH